MFKNHCKTQLKRAAGKVMKTPGPFANSGSWGPLGGLLGATWGPLGWPPTADLPEAPKKPSCDAAEAQWAPRERWVESGDFARVLGP